MHQTVAQENVADAEAFGVAARLLLRGQRVDAFAFGFDNRDGTPVGVEQQVIDEALRCVFEIVAQVLSDGRTRDAVFALNVGGLAVRVGMESPAGFFQKFVDGDAGLGFGRVVHCCDLRWLRTR